MTPVRLLSLIAGWLVAFLFVLTDVGENYCTEPYVFTVGHAAIATLWFLAIFVIGFAIAVSFRD